MRDTPAAIERNPRRVIDLTALTDLGEADRVELARSIATGTQEPLQDLARQLLDAWDELDPVARIAGLTVFAVALSWWRDSGR